jgi:hypothetical protein
MKRLAAILFLSLMLTAATGSLRGQCAMCTKTAQQLGEKPAKGLNQGILYLMLMPLGIAGFIGYRWWKGNRGAE